MHLEASVLQSSSKTSIRYQSFFFFPLEARRFSSRVFASSQWPMTIRRPAVQNVLEVSAPAPSVLSAQSIFSSNFDGDTKLEVIGIPEPLTTSSLPKSFLVRLEPSPLRHFWLGTSWNWDSHHHTCLNPA